MGNTIIAKRYGRALFDLAQEKDLVAEFEQQLRTIKHVFKTEQQLLAILSSLNISLEKKQTILKNIFSDADPLLQNALMLIVERQRDQYVVGIATHFIELANEARGVAEAKAYTVRPLTEEEEKAISAAFAKKVGKKSLQIENIIDEDLLGGLKLQIGNKIFDGSIKGKIERLERQLLLG